MSLRKAERHAYSPMCSTAPGRPCLVPYALSGDHQSTLSPFAILWLAAKEGSPNSKIMSHAVWYPTLARAHVIVSRGVHFASLGHSVARSEDNYPVHTMEGKNAMNPKRLELLPEEALYLVERGALSCSLASYDGPSGNSLDEGIPMTVQQTFDEVIGREDLTLEKYQVCYVVISAVWAIFNMLCAGIRLPQASWICGNSSPSAFSRLPNAFPLHLECNVRFTRTSNDVPSGAYSPSPIERSTFVVQTAPTRRRLELKVRLVASMELSEYKLCQKLR